MDLGFVMVERDCGGEGDELSGTTFVMGDRIFVRMLFGASCRSRGSGFVGGALCMLELERSETVKTRIWR